MNKLLKRGSTRKSKKVDILCNKNVVKLVYPFFDLTQIIETRLFFRKFREKPPPYISGVLTLKTGINENIASTF